jgi:AraC-like DNA-binding protein
VLASFVEEYGLREDRLGVEQIYNPLPARADCFLQFYLADRYRVVTVGSGAVHLAPLCVLVGPHTRRREDLVWTGHLRIFTIRLSAVGFRALFGLSAESVRDYAGAAQPVLGRPIVELEERLRSAGESELAAVAEEFLLERLRSARAGDGGGAALKMVRAIRAEHGGLEVGGLAARYGFSVRQVERLFHEHVGVSPKVFGRLARLRRAMRLGEGGETEWADVAARSGYFDQSHMVREFQALNGATPVQFRALGARAARFRQAQGMERDVAFVLSGAGTGLVA